MQYWNLCELVRETMKKNPSWRKGQTWFNVVYNLFPHLANRVRGTNLDPFYRDDRVHEFTKWLRKVMEE